MRSRTIGFAVAVGLLAFAGRTMAADVYVFGNPPKTFMLIDRETISKLPSGYNRVWAEVVSVDPFLRDKVDGRDVHIIKMFDEVDCNLNRMRTLQTTVFDANDERIRETRNHPSDWKYVIPETNQKLERDLVCGLEPDLSQMVKMKGSVHDLAQTLLSRRSVPEGSAK